MLQTGNYKAKGWVYKYSWLNKRVIASLHSEYVSTAAEERKERDE